jgi:hypothetical protein
MEDIWYGEDLLNSLRLVRMSREDICLDLLNFLRLVKMSIEDIFGSSRIPSG